MKWVTDLTIEDEKILLNDREWLMDRLINASQRLIKECYPHVCGLQDVSLGHTLAFDVPVGEFVQVLHTGRGHWVTISTIACDNGEVDVFDSMTPALTDSLKNQIAALLCTKQKAITVRYVTFTCTVDPRLSEPLWPTATKNSFG